MPAPSYMPANTFCNVWNVCSNYCYNYLLCCVVFYQLSWIGECMDGSTYYYILAMVRGNHSLFGRGFTRRFKQNLKWKAKRTTTRSLCLTNHPPAPLFIVESAHSGRGAMPTSTPLNLHSQTSFHYSSAILLQTLLLYPV